MLVRRRKPMIAHVSIGARDIARARRFYDATLKPLGYACLHPAEDSLGYGTEAADF
jgi:catechol 2,3-dioxygenase-like lactoylglutathione lyase family enzyme